MRTVGDRLRHIRAVLGLTQEAFASVLRPHVEGGLTRGAVGNWERNEGIKTENLTIVSQVTGVSLDWLANGIGKAPMQAHDLLPSEGSLTEDIVARQQPTVRVPEFDVRAGASYGGGIDAGDLEVQKLPNGSHVAQTTPRDYWALPSAFIRGELRVDPSRVDIISIQGPSMDDGSRHALIDGDRVIISRDETRANQGGIFAIWDGESVIVKAVQLVRGADPPKIRCISLNPTFEPFEILLGDDAFIIGRVAGRISRM